MEKKIGPLLLSGLMIGPILGSGIILLPPLAYGKLGTGTIWSWIIIMFLGALFAMIFSKLSILHPGDGGMTIAIEEGLGKRMKLYASLLIISAVTFGPTAVLLTASDYLVKLAIFKGLSKSVLAMALVIVSLLLLLKDVKFISTLSFILSSAIAVTLLLSSVLVLIGNPVEIAPLNSVGVVPLGKVVLLLFWAIIGWEIVGNYSDQVKNIKRTIPMATTISLAVITLTYIVISLAIQVFPYTENLSLVEVLAPVFGKSAIIILALLVTGLCLCTYLLIVGALSRLVSSLAVEGYLPVMFSKKNRNNIPHVGVLYFVIVHIAVLIMTEFGIFNLERIISIANGFFLANAVIGLVASLKVIKGLFYKLGGLVLIISLLVILSFSTFDIFLALVAVFLLTFLMKGKDTGIEDEEIREVI